MTFWKQIEKFLKNIPVHNFDFYMMKQKLFMKAKKISQTLKKSGYVLFIRLKEKLKTMLKLEKIYAAAELMGYSVCILTILFVIATSFRQLYRNKKNPCLKYMFPQKATGILFGKKHGRLLCSPTNQEGHIAIFGGSGLGKTSALLIPTLRGWTGTSFVIDISGDICNNVKKNNKLVYAPSNPKSTPYNIFSVIDQLNSIEDKNEALEQFAFLLMPDSNTMTDTSRFFQTEGRKILTASLIAFYHQQLDFIEICEKIVFSSWKELFTNIDDTNNQKAIQYINSFHGASEQNTAGCKQACDSVLKLFATDEKIKKTIRRPIKDELSFTPEMLERWNVFIVIDDSKLNLYAPLLRIITAQSLEYFSNRSNYNHNSILFCLDEFASLGKMEITDALRKLRKKNIRIMMLTQSMADIDLIYGREERMAMMNNYCFKVILGASDTDTQEYFAKLIGYVNKKKKSTSRSSKSTTHTVSEVKEYAIEPSDLSRLRDSLILLHPDGYTILKKNFYFKK